MFDAQSRKFDGMGRRCQLIVWLLIAAVIPFVPDDALARHRRRCCRSSCGTCQIQVATSSPGSCGIAPPALAGAPRKSFMSAKGRRYSFVETDEPGTEEELREEI